VHGHGPAKDSLVVFLSAAQTQLEPKATARIKLAFSLAAALSSFFLPKKFPTFERAANIWGNGGLLSGISDIKVKRGIFLSFLVCEFHLRVFLEESFC
jgi:hypothetical protein